MLRIRAKRREEKGVMQDWKGGVVIDLDFDDLMNDQVGPPVGSLRLERGLIRTQEIKSMASQLCYVYSANRLAERPFQTLLHTSFSAESSPRLWEKMLKTKREVWNRCYWTEGGIDRLADRFGSCPKDHESQGPDASSSSSSAPKLQLPETISPETHSLVYLSADAEEELETLAENEIYIIGGIVDKNRYKVCPPGAGMSLIIAMFEIADYSVPMPGKSRKV